MKEAVFTMKLEPELRAAFVAAAQAAHRPASQIVRELMRDFVQKQGNEAQYQDFLQRKVNTARASVSADRGRSAEEVELLFASMRSAT